MSSSNRPPITSSSSSSSSTSSTSSSSRSSSSALLLLSPSTSGQNVATTSSSTIIDVQTLSSPPLPLPPPPPPPPPPTTTTTISQLQPPPPSSEPINILRPSSDATTITEDDEQLNTIEELPMTPVEVEPIPAFVVTKQPRERQLRIRSYSCAPSATISRARAIAAKNRKENRTSRQQQRQRQFEASLLQASHFTSTPVPSSTTTTGGGDEQQQQQQQSSTYINISDRSPRYRIKRTLSSERLPLLNEFYDADVLLNAGDDNTNIGGGGHGGVNLESLSPLLDNEYPTLDNNNGSGGGGIHHNVFRNSRRQNNGDQPNFRPFTDIFRGKVPPPCPYESLDYDQCENMLQLEEESIANRKGLDKNLEFTRWLVIFTIGILTGFTACLMLFCVEVISKYKYTHVMYLFNGIDSNPNFMVLLKPYALWLASNAFPTFLGSILVTYVAPVAAGSGIPVIKCYLNGVKVPEVVRVKTYVAKALGVIGSVCGGLACGKEGPMIHCGSAIAAGISQGKSTTFGFDWKIGLTRFREDHEKRDFVSAGAAAGVSAAFGAPLGGVLFSLEEGASFWNQLLVIRIFFCSLVSSFTLNFVVSIIRGQKLGAPGLLNFGKFQDIDYSYFEIPLYAAMGIFGGLTGAAWNYLNMKITIFRMRYLKDKRVKVLEAVLISMVTCSVGFLLICLLGDCYSHETEQTDFPVGYGCSKNEHNVMAALWFNTPEATLKNLFHNNDGTWAPQTLAVFVTTYFFISCITYGLSVSSGLFIPGLMLGAAWGRLFGIGLNQIFPGQSWIRPGKFALIGASASLGGIVRMTISLTVILIEATGNLTFALPIMITVIVAKWMGDLFNEGIYDIHIELSRVPFLGWNPPTNSNRIYASEVMRSPVVTLRTTETVRQIVHVLQNTSHNGFPVVDADSTYTHVRTYGRYRGLILRSQLLVMLKARIFNEYSLDSPWKNLYQLFRDSYPRMPKLNRIVVDLAPYERDYTLDLRPVMNPSAFTVSHAASLNRIFRLFRALGLRHIVVLNDYNEVVGMVTRKDIAKYCEHYNTH